MPISGRATAVGTARYAARFNPAEHDPGKQRLPGHFRAGLGLTMSSIGAGTYLGETSDAVDEGYQAALSEAVRRGCNVLDTAVSYRVQRSELAVGRAVAALIASGEAARDELVIASKGGFIAYYLVRPANPMDYIYEKFMATGVIEPEDLAGGIHCIAPRYLSQQIIWSLRNLGLHTLDVYYIHNPETQLAFVDRTTFRRRMQLAFARLEEEVADGHIGCYGVATWDGLRRPHVAADYISLEVLVQLAAEAAGPNHHFKALQLPLNAAMTGAATFRNQPVRGEVLTPLAAAERLSLTVTTSASVMQGQLSERLKLLLSKAFPKLPGAVLPALQFTRSLPGVCTSLVGMAKAEHAGQNMALAAYPPEPKVASQLAGRLPR